MIDRFEEAHSPSTFWVLDDEHRRRVMDELREANARLQERIAYHRLWSEYIRLRDELRALEEGR